MYCARTWCRDLYITGFIMYKVKLMLVWIRARQRTLIQTNINLTLNLYMINPVM